MCVFKEMATLSNDALLALFRGKWRANCFYFWSKADYIAVSCRFYVCWALWGCLIVVVVINVVQLVFSDDVGIRIRNLTDTMMRADDIDISTSLSLPHGAPCALSRTESVRRVWAELWRDVDANAQETMPTMTDGSGIVICIVLWLETSCCGAFREYYLCVHVPVRMCVLCLHVLHSILLVCECVAHYSDGSVIWIC